MEQNIAVDAADVLPPDPAEERAPLLLAAQVVVAVGRRPRS